MVSRDDMNDDGRAKRRRCLITGGAGFIGSHLAEKLLRDGCDVVVIDDLSTGRLENIRHLADNPRFDHVIDSVTNEPLVQNLVANVDEIFHLASGVGVMSVVNSPIRTIETTIIGTDTVLRCAASTDNRKVLITSSSEVYGKGTKVPFSEDDDMLFGPTVKSRWSYGCSKAIDEFLALAYHKELKLPVVIARLFNTVGPRQVGTYGMVLPRFVEQAISGGPIIVFGDGEQTRCFVSVTDVVDALCRLMNSDDAVGRIVNVGSDDEISINSLAERVREIVNPNVEITHIPYDEAYEEGFEDLLRRVPDLERIRELIDFDPVISLDEIIESVAEYARLKQQNIDDQ